MVASRGIVLVVDDDPDIRDSLIEILGDEGFTAIGAFNGQDAIRQLRTAPRPTLILLDLMMPVMDGWQFREEQSQDPELWSIPVVVLSANASVPEQARSMRAAGYLRKPVGLDTLLSMVTEHCQERSAQKSR